MVTLNGKTTLPSDAWQVMMTTILRKRATTELLTRTSQLAVSTAAFPEGFCHNVIIVTSDYAVDAFTDAALRAETKGVVASESLRQKADKAGMHLLPS